MTVSAFLLLSFYVQAAFRRHNEAARIWYGSLRTVCHRIATVWPQAMPGNAHYKGDLKRVFGLLASLPIVLKHHLRDSKDLSELRGLLSNQDLAAIHVAENMPFKVIDMLKAHVLEFYACLDRVAEPENVFPGASILLYCFSISALEGIVQRAVFLASFPISSAFVYLLDLLTVIWFFLLPFVLAESSGWFTILWILIITYSVLGLRSVAVELQQPFGFDLNDHDLDKAADAIVKDILHVQRQHSAGVPTYVFQSETSAIWSSAPLNDQSVDDTPLLPEKVGVGKHFWLIGHAVHPLVMVALIVWAGVCAVLAWVTHKYWEINDECPSLWCSRISVNSDVMTYIGFSLFLLLGFRLFDSHSRYTSALSIWQGAMTSEVEDISNTIFSMSDRGIWHPQDHEKIAGHLSASGVMVMSNLRRESFSKSLREYVSETDAQIIESEPDGASYCLDVVRSYFILDDMNGRVNARKCSVDLLVWLGFASQRIDSVQSELEQIKRAPLPYGYLQHMRIVLVIWLLLLPLGLVESSQWLSILWSAIISYGVVGISTWCDELADPFGHDISDVPLESLVGKLARVVKENLFLSPTSTYSFIHSHRSESFPAVTENDNNVSIPIER